ncbi:MAG: AAA family ATPase [Oceanococcus sp.]|nr:MAG: AAA family ATPase [Oceanococcus sp.]
MSILAEARDREAAQNKPAFALITPDELLQRPLLSWRIKGVLPSNGLAAIYGPSGSGKSFLALDALGAIASGRNWFDYRVKQAPCIYVGLEGESGLRQRLEAYSSVYGKPDNLRFITTALNIREPAQCEALATAIKAEGMEAGVVVIDTLNMASHGADENSSADMGEIVAGLKYLRLQLGGLILAVHHTGKDASKGLRGHSSLHAALDAAIEVSADGCNKSWRIAKAKDGDDTAIQGFRLAPRLLGTDEDGDPVSSCVVEAADAAPSSIPKQPKGSNQRIALKALKRAMQGVRPNAAGKQTMPLEDALIAVGEAMPVEPKRKRERASLALSGLQGAGNIEHEDGQVWIP